MCHRLVAVILAVTACALAEETLPMLHWGFDVQTGRGERDLSGHGRHALLISGANPRQHPPTSREDGKGIFGGAAEIHSRSLIRSLEPVLFGDTWTLSFWMKQTKLQHANLFVGFDGMEASTSPAADTMRFAVAGMAVSTVKRPGAGQWEHVAIVVQPGYQAVWYNGSLVDEYRDSKLRFRPTTSMLVFGARDIHRMFWGYFDEIRLYDRALGPEKIAELANPGWYPTANYPPEVSAGPAATIWQPQSAVTLSGEVRDDGNGGAPLTHLWRVKSAPEGTAVVLANPEALVTRAQLPAVGDYVFELTVTDGPYTIRREVNAVVFPPWPERGLGESYDGPHHAPPAGYSERFVATHFPPLGEVPRHRQGFAADRFTPPPPPYVHPRIFFNPEDLPAIRQQLHRSEAGRRRLQRLRDALGQTPWVRRPYELPPEVRNLVIVIDDDGLPTEAEMPTLDAATLALVRESTPEFHLAEADEPKPAASTAAKSETLDFYRPMIVFSDQARGADLGQAGTMVNEALRCLIDADTKGARQVIEAVLVPSARASTQWLRSAEMQQVWNWQQGVDAVVGRHGMALIYDWLYPWMTDDERDIVREALALATGGRWAIGMRAVNAGNCATGNWVCWLMGDLTINLLAIEGEDGFDRRNYEDCVEAWRKFLTYGFFAASGAPMEALGKGLMSAEKLVAVSKRSEPLIAAESVYRFGSEFLLHTMLPQGGQFIRDDLHGGIGKPTVGDIVAIKHAFPEDPAIDWVYRNAMEDGYPGGVAATTYAAAIPSAPMVLLDDWSGPAGWQAHLEQTLRATGGLPLSYFAADTGVMVVRDRWARDALHLYFRPRRLGGHRAPNRGQIVVSALGRTWSHHSAMGERAGSQGYSLVLVDGQTNSADDARVIHYQDSPTATFAAADLTRTYARGGPAGVTWNDSRIVPLKAPWAALPAYQMPHWYDGTRPAVPEEQWDAVAKTAAEPQGRDYRPFAHAFRTAGIVRGKHPYLLVIDDVRQDGQVRHYDWLFRMAADVRVFRIEPKYFRLVDLPEHGEYFLPTRPQGGDIVLAPREVAGDPPVGTPMLLVRVLERHDQRPLNPLAYVQNDPAVIHGAAEAPTLIVPAYTDEPRFKVMLLPFRWQVDSLPVAGWAADGNTLSLKWPDQTDMITFERLDDGRTAFSLERLGEAADKAYRFGKDPVADLLDELDGAAGDPLLP